MRRFGLIGFPLTHSFSRNYFSNKFEVEGHTDCCYELFPISSVQELPALLQQYPDLVGLNVTIPYKQQVLPFLHDTSALPASLQACNTIRIRQGQLAGFNTDWVGFEESLVPLLLPHHRQALVLGNGGASRAVLYVLQRLGIGYEVVSRQLHEGSTITYDQLTPELVGQHTLIINTTPLGTYPNIDEQPPLPYKALTAQHLLYDLVYNPATTRFMQQGQQQGATVKNGYDMLVGQAEAAWRIWNEA